MSRWKDLNSRIEGCRKCTRLIEHCEKVSQTRRRQYRDELYWGKPVPNFGRAKVPLLIVGLAPGAHGANRTGRMFTGDRSGEWLYRALHKAGFANQQSSTGLADGLRLKSCAVTNVCHCAPPDNKPTSEELQACSPYFEETVELCAPRVFLALGAIAWNAVARFAQSQGWIGSPRPKFGHASCVELKPKRGKSKYLLGCYHPSQQNTFTGRLTEPMIDQIMCKVKNLLDSK